MWFILTRASLLQRHSRVVLALPNQDCCIVLLFTGTHCYSVHTIIPTCPTPCHPWCPRYLSSLWYRPLCPKNSTRTLPALPTYPSMSYDVLPAPSTLSFVFYPRGVLPTQLTVQSISSPSRSLPCPGRILNCVLHASKLSSVSSQHLHQYPSPTGGPPVLSNPTSVSFSQWCPTCLPKNHLCSLSCERYHL